MMKTKLRYREQNDGGGGSWKGRMEPHMKEGRAQKVLSHVNNIIIQARL